MMRMVRTGQNEPLVVNYTGPLPVFGDFGPIYEITEEQCNAAPNSAWIDGRCQSVTQYHADTALANWLRDVFPDFQQQITTYGSETAVSPANVNDVDAVLAEIRRIAEDRAKAALSPYVSLIAGMKTDPLSPAMARIRDTFDTETYWLRQAIAAVRRGYTGINEGGAAADWAPNICTHLEGYEMAPFEGSGVIGCRSGMQIAEDGAWKQWAALSGPMLREMAEAAQDQRFGRPDSFQVSASFLAPYLTELRELAKSLLSRWPALLAEANAQIDSASADAQRPDSSRIPVRMAPSFSWTPAAVILGALAGLYFLRRRRTS